ncbi:MAG: hypothetical protein V3V62_13835, partial [bacterium]
GQAYIFFGPEGVGEATAALLFAQALQCQRGAPSTEDSPGGGRAPGDDTSPAVEDDIPCGECPPCRKVLAGVHPDVITARPEVDKKTGKAKGTIGIDAIREQVLHPAHLRPQEGRSQVFLLDGAHTITRGAFNALLKTLEEPPPDTFFLLITPNLHALPATVISRCRRLRFAPLGRAEMRAILSGKLEEGAGGGGPEGSDFSPDTLIGLSQGRLGVALGEDPEGLARRREAALEMLQGLSAPPGEADEAALLTRAAEEAGRGDTAREAARLLLQMLRGLVRDILILQAAPGELEPWSADLAGELDEIGRRWGEPGLIQALEKVETAVHDVSVVNTNPALTLETLIIALRSTVAAGA